MHTQEVVQIQLDKESSKQTDNCKRVIIDRMSNSKRVIIDRMSNKPISLYNLDIGLFRFYFSTKKLNFRIPR